MTDRGLSVRETFNELIRISDIHPSGGPLAEALWAAAGKSLESLTRSHVHEIIKALLGRSAESGALELLKTHVSSEHTSSFTVHQQPILLAALLVRLLERRSETATYAAIGVATALCGGARDSALAIDWLPFIESTLERLSRDGRKRPKMPKRSVPELDTSSLTLPAEPTTALTVQQAQALIATTNRTVHKLATELGAQIDSLQRIAAVQEEELNHTWWLLGGLSLNGNTPFEKVAAERMPLEFASQLCDLTDIPPGPLSVAAFLHRAGAGSNLLTIPEAVNACDIAWLQSVASDDPSSALTPVLLAISRRIETGEKQQWIAGWSGVTGISAGFKMSANALGVQFYRELQVNRM